MSTLEWIDSHAHLNYEYPFSIDEYLANARAQGVSTFVTIGTEAATLPRLCELAEAHPEVYFTVGVHPHEAKDFDAAAEKEMDRFRGHPKCVGVGEIGLDFHYDHSPRDVQIAAFERQLALAVSWKKPIVIHAREAEPEILERLARYVSERQAAGSPGGGPGIIHCFSGTRDFALESLKLGFYISFSGIVTFKKADDLRAIAKEVPLDRILLETDSPFLSPVPHRGKPNQSAYLVEIAKLVAQVKDVDLAALSSATVANSRRIFGLPSR